MSSSLTEVKMLTWFPIGAIHTLDNTGNLLAESDHKQAFTRIVNLASFE